MITLARFAIVLATVVATGPALAQSQPYEGRWAERAQYCGNRWGPVDNPSQVPIVVGARRLQGALIDCRFNSVRAAGANRWRVSAVCSGEGERNRETFDLSIANDRLTWHWGTQPPTYVRCARP